MSFFASTLERAKRELSREPRGGRSMGKKRIVVGCVLVVVAPLAYFLGGKDNLLLWLVNLTLGACSGLLGVAALLYESRRTLTISLRLASILIAAVCFALFVAYVLDIWS